MAWFALHEDLQIEFQGFSLRTDLVEEILNERLWRRRRAYLRDYMREYRKLPWTQASKKQCDRAWRKKNRPKRRAQKQRYRARVKLAPVRQAKYREAQGRWNRRYYLSRRVR